MGIKGRAVSMREQNCLKVAIFSLRRMLRAHQAQIEIRNVYGIGYQAQPTGETASSL